MRRFRAVVLASLAGAVPALGSTDLVLPLGYQSTQGTASFLGPLANSQRTYQMLIHSDQLQSVVGMDLTGVAFRTPTSATSAWPTVETTYSSYEIHLSESVAPADRSLVMAQNVVGPQIMVRSGALVIGANSYGFGSTPNPFGPTIAFDQPYTYPGGHLLIEIRHMGSDGLSRSVDAIGTSTAGYMTQFSAAWVGTTSVSQGNFAVIQLSAEAGVPGCYANCDGSTTEPILNVADFGCFLSKFAAGDAYANCDGSTTEPVLNVADFGCFLGQFAAGCR